MLSQLVPGDWCVLVSRATTNGWLPVIRLSSGRQGWVRPERLALHYTSHPNPSVDLEAGATGTDDQPALSVENDTDKDLYLHVQGTPEVVISARTSRSLNVLPGVWNYNASAANVIPAFGNHAFIKGVDYSWSFTIVKHATSEHHTVSPADQARLRVLQDDVDTREAEVKLLKAQLDDEDRYFDALKTKLKASDDDLDAKRQTLDLTDQAAMDAFNSLVDAANGQRDSCNAARDKYNADVDAYNAKVDAMKAKRQELKGKADAINAHN